MSLRPTELKTSSSLVTNEPTSAPAIELKFEDLTETEKSAASLGVDSNALKPISFMNDAHHETLLRANMLDDSLAKKLEAYKAVASGESK